MNARQKSKALKKELDYIKSQSLRYVYKAIDTPVEHLRSSITLPLYEVNADKSFIEDEVRLQLANSLAKEIRSKIVVNENETSKGSFPAIEYSTDIWIAFSRK